MDKIVTKQEILSFIREQEVVWIETLSKRFGYTYWGAVSRLKRLCKEGLIEPLYSRGLNQGRYMLTGGGDSRLDYLMKNKKSKKQAEQVNQLQEDEREDTVERLSQRVIELEIENEALRKQNQQLLILHPMNGGK